MDTRTSLLHAGYQIPEKAATLTGARMNFVEIRIVRRGAVSFIAVDWYKRDRRDNDVLRRRNREKEGERQKSKETNNVRGRDKEKLDGDSSRVEENRWRFFKLFIFLTTGYHYPMEGCNF